jgi:hypothetical protein
LAALFRVSECVRVCVCVCVGAVGWGANKQVVVGRHHHQRTGRRHPVPSGS